MARSGQPRVAPGFPVSPASPPAASATRDRPRLRPAARELWLAVHLPHYVLESLQPSVVAAPVVVVDLERGAKVVCDCDARAAAAGVVPGMALNSALALQPGLEVRSREPRRERAQLEAVAATALDFTPRVNLEPPDGVLLEVRGSLRLFGGARRLCELLRARLQAQGIEPRLALTPAPLASLWFARAGQELLLRLPDALAARVAPLPLAVTRWPERMLQSLGTMGVRTVGECLRLPRDGFARRFAPHMLVELDRALGRTRDPRATFVAPQRFATRRDLEPELADTARVQHACEPLLDELCAFLRGRGAGIDSLELRLLHRDAAATRLRLRFVEPVTAAAHIASLLRERLARVVLPEPVRSVRLRSGPLLQARAQAGDLFALDRHRSAAVPQLVERLRARLGDAAVHGLCLVPEHRPERSGDILPFSGAALLPAGASEKKGECPRSSRPVWLLAAPQPLAGGEQPRYEGMLDIEAGPERIESGWWDGHDVRRDYYVARTPAGTRLWIFRERRADGGWFLHGVFG